MTSPEFRSDELSPDYRIPVVQFVPNESVDNDTKNNIQTLNLLLKGFSLYNQWCIDSATVLSDPKHRTNPDVLPIIKGNYSQMLPLVDLLKTDLKNSTPTLWNDQFNQQLQETIQQFERNKNNSPLFDTVNKTIESQIDFDQRYKQYRGMCHALSNKLELISALLENVDSKDNVLIQLQQYSSIISNFFEAIEERYTKKDINCRDLTTNIKFDSTFPELTDTLGLHVIFIPDHTDCKLYKTAWSHSWLNVTVQEILRNAEKAYRELEELHPLSQPDKKISIQTSIFEFPAIFDQLNNSETNTLKNSALHTSENVVVISFKDNGIGVDKEIEENGLQVGKSIHTNTSVTGTGMGISYLKSILETYYNGLLFVHNRRDNEQGAEVMILLPAYKK